MDTSEEAAGPDAPADEAVGPGKPRRTDWQDQFLDAFGLLGIQTEAARAARVSLDTVKRERDRDAAFAERFAEAKTQADGVLLRFLHDRGTTGQTVKRTTTTTRTLPDGGIETTVSVVETALVSTPALLSLCKARMPEMFDDRLRIAGHDGGAVQVEEVYREPTPERALELAQIVVDLAPRREARARAAAGQ